jgi:hypothetical protein
MNSISSSTELLAGRRKTMIFSFETEMLCGPTTWFGPAVGGLWLLGCGLVASPLYFFLVKFFFCFLF